MSTSVTRSASVLVAGRHAGRLTEHPGPRYRFEYDRNYSGAPVSLTMPLEDRAYEFDRFPPFFDGLLPEGWQLEALLRSAKLDRRDYMGQLLAVGADTVGAVTVLPEDPPRREAGVPPGKPAVDTTDDAATSGREASP